MSAWAKPGVKCVCIYAEWKRPREMSVLRWLWLLYRGLPIRGGVYTITRIGEHGAGGSCLVLAGFGQFGFHSDFFRPLTAKTQEQDVAIFAPLLNTLRVDA